jgi:seryl-tRNA synthetase
VLDIRRIRDDPEGVRAALARRDPALLALLEDVLVKDRGWREATTEAEALRARQRAHSDAVAAARRSGDEAQAQLAEL